MTAIIDTSSLLALVRYYLPFDNDNFLKTFVRTKFENGELIVLDSVFNEARSQAKGIILEKLDFLSQGPPGLKYIVKTDNVLPSSKFIKRLDNEFCDKDVLKAKELTPEEYDTEKRRYLDGADAKIILYTEKCKLKTPTLLSIMEITTVVTEETPFGNDGKVFKKIPTICKLMELDCCTLPILLREHYSLNLSNFCH